MDRLIQDPGELVKGWAHRLQDVPAQPARPSLPALDLSRAADAGKVHGWSPGKSRRSGRGSARSGFMSVRSARSGGGLSPVSSLLLETKKVCEVGRLGVEYGWVRVH